MFFDYKRKNLEIFNIISFKLFKYLLLYNFLQIIYPDISHTIVHTIISNGQCTQEITREKFISIAIGKNIYAIFLYPVNNNAVANAILTAVWSDGKLASGIWFIMRFQTPCNTDSGLSKCTRFWMIIFISNANRVE